MPPAPSAPLVIRFGAFGDMVLMIPVLKLLHARYGRPADIVSSGPWTEPLLQRVPAAGPRFYLTSRRAPYWFNRSQQQLVRWLRTRAPGPVYVFEPDEKPLSLLRRAGIAPGWICTLRDLPRTPGEHILAHTLRLARATPAALAGSAPPDAPTPDHRPTLSDADRRDCETWLAQRGLADAPLVLVQAGNKKTMKRGSRHRSSNVRYWPEANWARAIAGVRAALPASRVILTGSPSERPIAEDIVALLPAGTEGVAIATDDLPISRLLALQARAHSMISVDTGPAHSAAAMGCPLAVMFTRRPECAASLYAPIPTSAPVKILETPADATAPDLSSIAPETVLAAWRGLCRL